MRQTILAAAVAFVIGGITTGAVLSQAQPTPPASPNPPAMGMPMEGHGPHGMMGMMEGRGPQGMMGGMHEMGEHGPFHHRNFALLYRQPDLKLSPADVQ